MIDVHAEVAEAVRAGRPVVALESAVVTTGLPPDVAVPLATRLQAIVRDGDAVPATVAVLDGRLRIGLDDDDLGRLAEAGAGCKASVGDLAAVMASGGGGAAGTTVSATLHACTRAGLRVMATGGIGGVHRGWTRHPDVSADLPTLASTPVCVVASGAKSILDLAATLQVLETLGVPVVAYRCDEMPQFYCRGVASLRAPRRVDDVDEAATLCRTHWDDLRSATGVLLANPVPADVALDAAEVERLVDAAEAEAIELNVPAAQRTPYLLRRVAEATDGRAVAANTALLGDNARLAAELANRLAK